MVVKTHRVLLCIVMLFEVTGAAAFVHPRTARLFAGRVDCQRTFCPPQPSGGGSRRRVGEARLQAGALRLMMAVDPAAADMTVGEELIYLLVYFLEFVADELRDPELALKHYAAMEWDRIWSPETFALAPIYLFMMIEVGRRASFTCAAPRCTIPASTCRALTLVALRAFCDTATVDTMRGSAAIVGHRCCVFLPLWLPRRVLLRG
jgi:hypothetical protein